MDRSIRLSRLFWAAFDGVAFSVYWAGHYIEYAFVLFIEAMRRIFQRLDLRLYHENSRIRTINEGRFFKGNGRFVVLVVYANSTVPLFTRTFIDSLKASPFDLVVVSNGRLAPTAVSELLNVCCLLIERENIGQDFGGYKDGISIVSGRFTRIERLVLANDSVFYLNRGLDKLIADLNGEEDFIGVSETYDHHYHVASFLMSFGPRVISNLEFRQFWKRYLPVGTRRWAIFQGEGALTAALLRSGFLPRVLFRAEHLEAQLRVCASGGAAKTLSLLPPSSRRRVAKSLLHTNGPAATQPSANESVAACEPDRFAGAVIAAIMARNQMHAAGFLFREFLGLPLIKRDIFYREIYPLEEIRQALENVEPVMRDEILKDVQQRGSLKDFTMFRKILYRHSAA